LLSFSQESLPLPSFLTLDSRIDAIVKVEDHFDRLILYTEYSHKDSQRTEKHKIKTRNLDWEHKEIYKLFTDIANRNNWLLYKRNEK